MRNANPIGLERESVVMLWQQSNMKTGTVDEDTEGQGSRERRNGHGGGGGGGKWSRGRSWEGRDICGRQGTIAQNYLIVVDNKVLLHI